jgi:septum formation protein
MLEAAGVEFETAVAGVDETIVKRALSGAKEIASELAKAKALSAEDASPGTWVIGSDSVVSVEGRLCDKARDRAEAADHLRFFSGKTMDLTSAVALARGGKVDWSYCDTARLEVRRLSEPFITAYLDSEWPQVAYCVGVFRLEGPGVQLFDRIDGAHFTILGMPLLPLLAALRQRGVLAA